jgi:hypothetical protein
MTVARRVANGGDEPASSVSEKTMADALALYPNNRAMLSKI